MHFPVLLLPILFALGFNNQEKGVLARKSDDLWMSAQFRLHVGSRCRADIESNIGPI